MNGPIHLTNRPMRTNRPLRTDRTADTCHEPQPSAQVHKIKNRAHLGITIRWAERPNARAGQSAC